MSCEGERVIDQFCLLPVKRRPFLSRGPQLGPVLPAFKVILESPSSLPYQPGLENLSFSVLW